MIPRIGTGLQRSSWLGLALLLAGACDDSTPLAPADLALSPATNLTATAVAYDRIYVSWLDNGRNESGWEIYRSTTGPSGSFSLLRTLIGNASEMTDVGLTALTEYCYKVRSYRSSGPRTTHSEFSNVGCATTPAIPLPPAPIGLNARPICCHAIALTWTDASSLETGFRIERAASSSGPWSLLVTLGPDLPSYTDGVDPEQTFCYRVTAFNAIGASDPSNIDCSAVPEAPTNLAAVASGRDVNLTWTDNSALEDGYEVFRASQTADWAVIVTLPSNTTGYRDAALPDNQYWYFVRAVKDGGNSGNSNQAQAVIASSPPAAPSGLDAIPQTSTSVAVAWIDGSNNEAGFRLQRSSDGGATWTLVSETNFTNALDQGRSPDAAVCYRAVAFNSAGESSPTNTDCTAPPAGPTGLTATGIDGETIDFAWQDNSAVEDAYELQLLYCYYYYSYYEYCYWSPVVSLGPNTTSYRFRDPGPYLYTYAVVAIKDGGWSDWSNQVSPTAPPSGSAARARRP
jgi:titin